MRGTFRKISIPRRFVIDLMRASTGVPFVSLIRTLDLRPLVEARSQAAAPPGWAAIFVKAFALVAREHPALRTLYLGWPRRGFYELPHSIAMLTVARVQNGEEWVLPLHIPEPDQASILHVDAYIRHAKEAPIAEARAFRTLLRVTRLPLPLRRLVWSVGLRFGRMRAAYFGSYTVTSVAAFGPGELHALSPGPFVLSYGVLRADHSLDVVLRWDHRVTDAAPMVRALARLEQVLNSEIAGEIRLNRLQTDHRQARTVGT